MAWQRWLCTDRQELCILSYNLMKKEQLIVCVCGGVMCAYICACAHSWLQVWVHTWRSEDNPKCPSSPSTLFELCSLGCWLLWSMGLWGLLWLCLPSSYNSPRITAVRTTMSALHGFWRVKLGSSNVCGKCSSSQVSSQALNLFHWFFWHYYKWDCCLNFLFRQYIVNVSSFWVSQIKLL